MKRRELTDAILGALQAASSDIKVGDGQAPAGETSKYATLYPLDVADLDGSYAGNVEHGWPIYQVTSVGESREQAEWVADTLRGVYLTWRNRGPLTIPNATVGPVQVLVLGTVERDDSEQPPLWYCADLFSLFYNPA